MDGSVWRELPSEILETILVFLPLGTAMKFKTVCKSWKNLLSSRLYYWRRCEIERDRPWLFVYTSGKFSFAFDFTLRRWHRIPNPPLYRESILCAAGNLVCLGNLVADCRVLSIYDPLKKLCKRLPPMNRIQFIHKVGMIVEEDSGLLSYKIMVAGEDDINSAQLGALLTEVYDSDAGIWRMAGETLPDTNFGLDAGVWVQNRFYCIVEMPYGIVTFDKNGGVWERLRADMPAGGWNDVASPSLAECKGRLLMVVRSSGGNNIRIWELTKKEKKEEEYEWRILQEMPERIRVEFMAYLECSNSQRLICCGAGDFVCITSHTSPRLLVFNLVSKTWEWLPRESQLFSVDPSFHLLTFPLEPVTPCEM